MGKECFMMGITRMPLHHRIAIAWKILWKRNVTFNIMNANLYIHANRNRHVTEVEL